MVATTLDKPVRTAGASTSAERRRAYIEFDDRQPSPCEELQQPFLRLQECWDQADPTADCIAEMRVELQEVAHQILALPKHQQITLILVCIKGHSYAETAEILDISIGTVMSRLFHARKTLRAARSV